MKHKTQKKRRKPKIVRTANYNCAHVSKMAVLIIFPVFLQTVINLIMLPFGGQVGPWATFHPPQNFTEIRS